MLLLGFWIGYKLCPFCGFTRAVFVKHCKNLCELYLILVNVNIVNLGFMRVSQCVLMFKFYIKFQICILIF